MRCEKCGRNLIKVDRREEMAELDEGATDGQEADYLAAELSGDNGAWNIAVIEYRCLAVTFGIRQKKKKN